MSIQQNIATINSLKIGEVIEASTTEFIAQCYELHRAPDFGSLVRASDGFLDIYGLVGLTRTASVDPGRRPIARGRDEPDEEAIYRNNPELPDVLRTEFAAVTVGFLEGNTVRQYLPPRPPRLHGFVFPCSPEETVNFTRRLDFLHTLVASPVRGLADELIAACLRQASLNRGGDRAFLVAAGRELAVLLTNDVNRLNGILRRIRP